MLSQGLSNRQVAQTLAISYDTARRYSSRVRSKLNLESAAALAGIIIPPDADALRSIEHIANLLTPAEMTVLALICRGMATKAIARHLGVSPRTVDKHRQHLCRKSGTHSARALAAWAASQYEQYVFGGIAVEGA